MESAADALSTSTRRDAGLRRRKAAIRVGAALALKRSPAWRVLRSCVIDPVANRRPLIMDSSCRCRRRERVGAAGLATRRHDARSLRVRRWDPLESAVTTGGDEYLGGSSVGAGRIAVSVSRGQGLDRTRLDHVRGDWSEWRYRIVSRAPAGWYIKRVLLGGADITDSVLEFTGADVDGVEIVLTRQETRLSGQVLEVTTDTKPNVAVILFAENERKLGPGSRYVRWAYRSADARYQLPGLRPGRYLAAAVAGMLSDQTTNPELLKRLRSIATRVDVSEGESATLDLTVREIP